jgi:ElaB/YqjD/DUF883 family membrane-anchored ribosome-binding protein
MTDFIEASTTEHEIETEPVTGESQKRIETMNDQQLETKVRKDGAKVQKDLSALVKDSATRLSKVSDDVSQATGKAKEDLTNWVDDSTARLNEGIEKVTGDAKETVATVKKNVGHGLVQYNAKAQEVADRVPGDLGKKATQYPWVAISVALVFGFLLGLLFRPARQPLG